MTYWKLRLSNSKANIAQTPRVLYLKKALNIEDTESKCQKYILGKLEGAWKDLRMTQKNSKDRRNSHLQTLAEHFVERWNTTRTIEVNKIKKYEEIRTALAKRKWYLKERTGMIRNLLVPDYLLHQILAIIGKLAWTGLMGYICHDLGTYLSNNVLILMVT